MTEDNIRGGRGCMSPHIFLYKTESETPKRYAHRQLGTSSVRTVDVPNSCPLLVDKKIPVTVISPLLTASTFMIQHEKG